MEKFKSEGLESLYMAILGLYEWYYYINPNYDANKFLQISTARYAIARLAFTENIFG